MVVVNPEGKFVTARLNARLQPLDRGHWFEDPLDELLRADGSGEVTGGGTQLTEEPAGIEFCDLEICLDRDVTSAIGGLLKHLEALGAPKGSRLIFEDGAPELPFGNLEGLAIFLNGTDLPKEVYRDSDVDHVVAECDRLMGENGTFRSYWRGSRETALYFYGTSFDDMNSSIAAFVASYPLCRKSRIERIA